MIKICENCKKEFEAKRGSARFCSDTCRVNFSRVSVTGKPVSVTVSVTKVTDKTVSVTKSEVRVPEDYYHSKKYLDLLKHLEETSIEDLTKEGVFIPAWKYAGFKRKPNAKEIIGLAGGLTKEKFNERIY